MSEGPAEGRDPKRAKQSWGGKPGEAGTASSRRIAGTAIVQLAGRALNVAIGVLAVALLARALGPGDFGIWSTALAFVGIFGVLTDLGLARVATQRMSAEPEREGEWLGTLMVTVAPASVLAFLLTLAALPLLGNVGRVELVTVLLALTLLCAAPGALSAVFQSRVRAEIPMVLLTVNSVLWLAAIFILDRLEAGVVAFAGVFAALTFLVTLVEWLTTRRYAVIAIRAAKDLWRPLLRVALPLGLAAVLVTIYYRIGAVLLFSIKGEVEAGIYGAAFRFLDPLHFLPVALMAAVFPVMSALHASSPQRLRALVQRSAEYLVVAGLGALAIAISLSDELVGFLLGPEFAASADLLPVLVAAFVFISLGYLAGYLVPIVGLQWRLVAIAAIGAVVNIGLNLALIPPFGALGAAWATVVCELVVNALSLYAVLRALRFFPAIGRIVKTFVAAAVTCLIGFAAAPLGLFVALALAATGYLALLFLLGVLVVDEIKLLIRREQTGAEDQPTGGAG